MACRNGLEATDRQRPKRVVEHWDRDEPDQAGLLRVELIELDTGMDWAGQALA